jgi:hypothetical protein
MTQIQISTRDPAKASLYHGKDDIPAPLGHSMESSPHRRVRCGGAVPLFFGSRNKRMV